MTAKTKNHMIRVMIADNGKLAVECPLCHEPIGLGIDGDDDLDGTYWHCYDCNVTYDLDPSTWNMAEIAAYKESN